MHSESPFQETPDEKPRADDEAILLGGLQSIRRVGDQIERPAGPHTATVHRLLVHLRAGGFDGSPEPIALKGPVETLSFVEGEVTTAPVSMSFRTDEALTTAASVLRAMHDASADFEHRDDDVWDHPRQEPVEVICHGDFAPSNCALNFGVISGVFDFDAAHPGPRLSDLGFAAYRWAPLMAPTNPGHFGDVNENWRRLRLFVDTYFDEGDESSEESSSQVHRAVIQAAIDRLTQLVDIIRERAEAGDPRFVARAEAGRDERYLADIEHLRFLLR